MFAESLSDSQRNQSLTNPSLTHTFEPIERSVFNAEKQINLFIRCREVDRKGTALVPNRKLSHFRHSVLGWIWLAMDMM